MKRSRYVALVGMSTSALFLTACDDPNQLVQAKVYDSIQACVADGNDQAQCARQFYTARDQYDANYPKYASKWDCEANAGADKCEPDYPNARSPSFRPMMLGFLLGAAMSDNRQPRTVPLIANAASPSGRATASGMPIQPQGVNVRVPVTATRPVTASQLAKAHPHMKATTTARGGFGGTAAKVSSASGVRASGGRAGG
ncbi:MAG: DUF1190 domain-containing protein [Hyphomicrobiaceae bacterium]